MLTVRFYVVVSLLGTWFEVVSAAQPTMNYVNNQFIWMVTGLQSTHCTELNFTVPVRSDYRGWPYKQRVSVSYRGTYSSLKRTVHYWKQELIVFENRCRYHVKSASHLICELFTVWRHAISGSCKQGAHQQWLFTSRHMGKVIPKIVYLHSF